VIRPRTVERARAAVRVVLAAVLVHACAISAAADTSERPGTAADCSNLLHQFDVAWPAHKDMARASAAHHSRDLGESDCSASRYTDGVRHLRRALHDIGVKPVKSVAAGLRS
jgi:hypothetical protein